MLSRLGRNGLVTGSAYNSYYDTKESRLSDRAKWITACQSNYQALSECSDEEGLRLENHHEHIHCEVVPGHNGDSTDAVQKNSEGKIRISAQI